jgi:hypothetical protein
MIASQFHFDRGRLLGGLFFDCPMQADRGRFNRDGMPGP